MLAIAVGDLHAFLPPESRLDGGSGLIRGCGIRRKSSEIVRWCLVMDVSPPLSLQQRCLSFRDALQEGVTEVLMIQNPAPFKIVYL